MPDWRRSSITLDTETDAKIQELRSILGPVRPLTLSQVIAEAVKRTWEEAKAPRNSKGRKAHTG